MNLLAYFPSPKKFKEVLGRLQKSDEKARDFVCRIFKKGLIIQSPGSIIDLACPEDRKSITRPAIYNQSEKKMLNIIY